MTQAQGPIALEFQAFYQLVRKRDDQQNKSLLDEYLTDLSQVRSKFNDLKNAGDIGPNAVALVKLTLNEQMSVFNNTQKIVDEKLTIGLNEADRISMQKLLISPLIQSFESLLAPAQNEINKLWNIQAFLPYQQTLSQKFPFNTSASVQATSNEISQILVKMAVLHALSKRNVRPIYYPSWIYAKFENAERSGAKFKSAVCCL